MSAKIFDMAIIGAKIIDLRAEIRDCEDNGWSESARDLQCELKDSYKEALRIAGLGKRSMARKNAAWILAESLYRLDPNSKRFFGI